MYYGEEYNVPSVITRGVEGCYSVCVMRCEGMIFLFTS